MIRGIFLGRFHLVLIEQKQATLWSVRVRVCKIHKNRSTWKQPSWGNLCRPADRGQLDDNNNQQALLMM
jgi:hypothetical protein